MGNDYFTKTRSVASVRVFSSSRFLLFGDLNGGPFFKLVDEDFLTLEVNADGPAKWNKYHMCTQIQRAQPSVNVHCPNGSK